MQQQTGSRGDEGAWAGWPRPRGWRLAVALVAPAASAAAAWLAWSSADGALTPLAAVTLGVLVLAAALWTSEAIPPVATSLLAIALCVALLGLPAHYGAAWALGAQVRGWTQFIAPAGSPVMLLLLGSLVLGRAFVRTGLDAAIGRLVLGRLLDRPAALATGVMLVSAFLSLWISNTASAAIMLAVTRPIWGRDTVPMGLRSAAALAVALGCNVGGIASPVGTPPNAIVFGLLAERGHPISFAGWMAFGAPLAAVLLLVGWASIRVLVPLPRAAAGLTLEPPPSDAPRWARRVTLAVFIATVALWLTEAWTGLPVAVAALVPLAALPALGVLRAADLNAIDWDVLLLILGGLVLGEAVGDSGLAAQAVGLLGLGSAGELVLVGATALVAMVLSAFMSNTATANLLAPLGLAVAAAAAQGQGDPRVAWLTTSVGIAIALGSGASMPFVVSTPANAMAHRTGVIRGGHLLAVGLIVGLCGVVGVTLLAWATRPAPAGF